VVNPHRHDEPMKNHTLMIVRAPYWDDEAKEERPARLVAKVRSVPFPARREAAGGDDPQTCRLVRQLHCRADRERPRRRCRPADPGGVPHLFPQEYETFGPRPAQTFEFGWESDDYTRSLWIGALSDAVREDTVIVEDVPTVMQLFQLHAKDAKRMRDAEALGVALH
jgi:hypothetical protein